MSLVVRSIIDPFLKVATRASQMTCEAFAERMDFDTWLSTYIDESHWDDSFDTEFAFERLIASAEHNGVRLTDADTWDYDRYFWNAYQCAEKGLS